MARETFCVADLLRCAPYPKGDVGPALHVLSGEDRPDPQCEVAALAFRGQGVCMEAATSRVLRHHYSGGQQEEP